MRVFRIKNNCPPDVLLAAGVIRLLAGNLAAEQAEGAARAA